MSQAKSLVAFLKENKVEKKPEKIFVTDSFIDPKTGKALLWEIRPIGSEEEKKISDAVVRTTTDRRTGTVTQIRDDAEYLAGLSAQSVVFPDLKDKELQDSYGVRSQVDLLRKLLTVGELLRLAENVMRISGLDLDDADTNAKRIEAEIDLAKN